MYIVKKIWSSDITELTSKHANLEQELVNSVTHIAYKIPISLLEYLLENKVYIGQLIERWPNKEISLLTYDNDRTRLYSLTQNNFEENKSASELKKLRQYDLSFLLTKDPINCSIKAPNGSHFVTPSGKHTKVFIRAGDAINSYNSMDRISFWLQEWITSSTAGVISDIPALLSVISHTFNLKKISLPFTCLKENPANSTFKEMESTKSILKKFSNRISNHGNVLIITSLSASGETEQSIKEAAIESGITNNIENISIFSLPNSHKRVNSLCTLDEEFKWFSTKTTCEYCEDNTQNIIHEINSQTLFPSLGKESPVRLKKVNIQSKDKNGIQEFYRAYGNINGIFKVHYSENDDGYSSRHHAFHIDISKIAELDNFKMALNKKLSSIQEERGKIDLIITPPHHTAKIIKNLISKSNSFEFIESSSLNNPTESELNKLKSKAHVLIIDDMLITGKRVLDYLRNIRKELSNKNEHNLKHLSFFPILLRPESDTTKKDIETSIKFHDWANHLDYMYYFLLPNWNSKECPWCEERKILSDIIADPLAMDEWFQKRLEHLDNFNNQGISNEPLLKLPGTTNLKMSGSSPIVDEGYSETVVLFVVASGLQALRDDKKDPLRNDLLICNSLNESSLSQYSDTLLHSALFRASEPKEWSRSFYNDLLSAGIEKTTKTSSTYAYAEIILKILNVRIENIDTAPFISELKKAPSNPSLSQLIDYVQEQRTKQDTQHSEH